MQDTDTPVKLPAVFANAAGGSYIETIPVASQIGITNGRASFADGFVPLNFTAVAAGGVPPFGKDFNGILFQITGGVRWLQAGGPLFYDGTFSAAVGGYPKGAVLQSATLGKWWQSTADNNTTDPDGGSPANWVAPFAYSFNGRVGAITLTSADITGALNSGSLVNAKLASMAAKTVKANITGSSAAPADVALSTFAGALGLPFTSKFTSTGISITYSSQALVAHGLGGVPFGVSVYLQNVTPEGGYSAGEMVQVVPFFIDDPGVPGRTYGVTASIVDSTNLRYVVSAVIYIPSVSSPGSILGITAARWNIILKAWI